MKLMRSIAMLCPLALALVMLAGMAPQATAQRVELQGDLAATNPGALASGRTRYRAEPGRARFTAQVEDVATDGTGTVVVTRNGNLVLTDTITIVLGLGDLNLNTNDGDTVPALQAGDVVSVFDPNGNLVVQGTLATK